MRWIEITVETTEAAEDAVSNALIEAGCGGVAIAGSSVLRSAASYADADTVFPDGVPSSGTLVRVSGYLPLDDTMQPRLEDIQARVEELRSFGIDLGTGEITVKPVDEEDWATAWKAFFKPLKVGNVVIKPSWEEYEASEGEIIIELDPGMAFGTGTHPTTQMCLVALQEHVRPGDTVLDMGSGSGILSMAAALLGAKSVTAIDMSSVAVEAASANVREAGLGDRISLRRGDVPTGGPYDLAVANIIAVAIINLSEKLAEVLKPGGILITSGIILEREDEVKKKLESVGFETLEAKHSGEWVAFVSRKRADG